LRDAGPDRHAGHGRHPGDDRHAGHDGHTGHGRSGVDRHAGHDVGMFRRRFWVALALTVPTVAWGHMLPSVAGWHPPAFPGSGWLPPVLGAAVFAYGGSPFVRGAARELRARLPGMMTLIALAIGVAFAFSVAVTGG
jgi:P-type Cu2+ transporter